jgi:hypothetical protein
MGADHALSESPRHPGVAHEGIAMTTRTKKATMTYLDDEERTLIERIERADARGELRPVKPQKSAIAQVQAIARRTLARKAARINIRLAPADLDLLKVRAKAEGLPYQTLIASILHKYVTPPAPAPVVTVGGPPQRSRSRQNRQGRSCYEHGQGAVDP